MGCEDYEAFPPARDKKGTITETREAWLASPRGVHTRDPFAALPFTTSAQKMCFPSSSTIFTTPVSTRTIRCRLLRGGGRPLYPANPELLPYSSFSTIDYEEHPVFVGVDDATSYGSSFEFLRLRRNASDAHKQRDLECGDDTYFGSHIVVLVRFLRGGVSGNLREEPGRR